MPALGPSTAAAIAAAMPGAAGLVRAAVSEDPAVRLRGLRALSEVVDREAATRADVPEHDDGQDDVTAGAPGFRSAAEMIAEAGPVEVVAGLAWAGCITVLVSESGVGKTFMLLGASAAVSDGPDWLGHAVTRGSVAYVSFEGDALGLRLRALREAGHALSDVYVLRAADPISPRTGRDGNEVCSMGEVAVTEALSALSGRLAAHGRPPVVLLVIDTVRASLAGSEDSSEHVSAYLRAVRRIMATVPGAAAVLAHHAGWLDGEQKRRRERGSSAWRGNVDATLYAEATEENADKSETVITVTALKVRDASRPAPLRLIRRRVDVLGLDERGEPLTSCLVYRDTRSRADREAETTAAAVAAEQAADLKVLAAMRDFPTATNQRALRTYTSLRTDTVAAAVGRILRAGFAVEGKRGQPYQVTPAGAALLTPKDERHQ